MSAASQQAISACGSLIYTHSKMCPLALFPGLVPLATQPTTVEMLSRVVEEAEVLRPNLPKALSEETLEQRAWMPPSRFRRERPGVGSTRLLVRTVISEYTVGPPQGSPILRFG